MICCTQRFLVPVAVSSLFLSMFCDVDRNPLCASTGPIQQEQSKPPQEDATKESQKKEDQLQMDQAIESLIVATKDPDAQVRTAAIQLIGNAKSKFDIVLKRLVELIVDPDAETSQVAIQSFNLIGAPPSQKFQILLPLLNNEDQKQVEVAEQMIRSLIVDEKLLDVFTRTLTDPMTNRPIKRQLFAILLDWGERAAPAIDSLAELYDQDDSWKVQILTVIRNSGPAAKNAMPLVTRAIKDKDANVRLMAINAMGAIWDDASAVSRRSNPSAIRYVDTIFAQMDTNKDGVLVETEMRGAARFEQFDLNKDKRITRSEMLRSIDRQMGGGFGSSTRRSTRTGR